MSAAPSPAGPAPTASDALTWEDLRAALQAAGVTSKDGRWIYASSERIARAAVAWFAGRPGGRDAEVARLEARCAELTRRAERAETIVFTAGEALREIEPAAPGPGELTIAQRIVRLLERERALAAAGSAAPRPLPGLATAARLGVLAAPETGAAACSPTRSPPRR